jgi:hypothetical protein
VGLPGPGYNRRFRVACGRYHHHGNVSRSKGCAITWCRIEPMSTCQDWVAKALPVPLRVMGTPFGPPLRGVLEGHALRRVREWSGHGAFGFLRGIMVRDVIASPGGLALGPGRHTPIVSLRCLPSLVLPLPPTRDPDGATRIPLCIKPRIP